MTDTPTALEGAYFHDWIAHNLNYKVDWSTLLVAEHLPRTIDSVEGLVDSLQFQIAEHAGAVNNEVWEKKASRMLVMAQGRLRQLERHAGASGKQLSAIKEFAQELCEILEDSDLEGELDLTSFPFGDITARQWLDRRRVKRGEVAA